MRRFISFVLLITLLAACSGSPEPVPTPPGGDTLTPAPAEPTSDPGAEGKVTISFAAWEYERQIYEPLAKKFGEEHPNIEVVIVPLDDLVNVSGPNADYSAFAQLRRVVAGADTAPAQVASPETLGSSLLLDLAPQMDADSSFKRDDYYPGALEQYTLGGATRVLPRYVYVQLLSYNKDMLKEAGLPAPKLGWTWNDMLGLAEQLASKNGSSFDRYGYLDISGGFSPLLALLKERNVDLFQAQAGQVRLDQPEVVESVMRLRGLIESGALYRPDYGGRPQGPADGPIDQPVDPSQVIRDGKVGIWAQDFLGFAGPRPIEGGGSSQAAELPFETGTIAYPANMVNPYTNVDGYIVSAGTEHPAEAWQWIEFLSRQQTDQAVAMGMAAAGGFSPPGRIPARQSVADQTGFWNNLDAETAEAYKWAIANPQPPISRTPDYNLIGGLSQALEQILGGEKQEPEKALRDAQKQMEEQMAQANLTPTPTPDLSPVAVATPEPNVAPEGATTIQFSAFAYNPSDLRRLSRAFRDQRPDIFVNIRSTDVYTEGPTVAQLAKTSDCFAWYSPPQTDADFAALLDLQPLFDADASFPQSDYAAALLSPYQRNGGLFGLPYAATLRTLNYNKTAFEAAGIQPPTDQWKPDDFLAAAQALTKGEGDTRQYGYVPLGGGQQDMFFFINQFGGQLVTGSGQDTRPNFSDPKVVQALQWYIDLAVTHKVMPPLKFPYQRDDSFDDRSYELVQSGRAGMWFDQGYGMFGGGVPTGPDGQPANFEVGIAPLPIGTSGLRAGDVYLRGLHISAQTEQQQACWEWMKFLSADVTNLQGALPARLSILDTEAFKSQATPDLIALSQAYASVLKRATAGSGGGSDPSQVYMFDTYWFFKALMEAIEGTTPLDQGLDAAQKTTNAYLDCMAQNPDQPKPATCALQADPDYKGYSTEDPPEGKPPIGIPLG